MCFLVMWFLTLFKQAQQASLNSLRLYLNLRLPAFHIHTNSLGTTVPFRLATLHICILVFALIQCTALLNNAFVVSWDSSLPPFPCKFPVLSTLISNSVKHENAAHVLVLLWCHLNGWALKSKTKIVYPECPLPLGCNRKTSTERFAEGSSTNVPVGPHSGINYLHQNLTELLTQKSESVLMCAFFTEQQLVQLTNKRQLGPDWKSTLFNAAFPSEVQTVDAMGMDCKHLSLLPSLPLFQDVIWAKHAPTVEHQENVPD